MKRNGEPFVGIDTTKARNAVPVAEGGREGKLRYLDESDNTPEAVAKLVRKLAERYKTAEFCYEAGPTGYGLHRQILALGHDCMMVAPSLIPRRPGQRVKTNRRDAQTLARLPRAGELIVVQTALRAERTDLSFEIYYAVNAIFRMSGTVLPLIHSLERSN